MEAANTMANRSSGSCTSQDHGKKERWARYSAFPPELRLQVIKAGIPYNTTCEVTRKQRFKTANDLIEVAHDLLLSSRQQKNSYERDPWANSESASTIKKMTEQAFFETVIFKLVTESALPTAFYHELSEASLVLLPKTIGTKARHLDIVHRVHGRYGPRSEQHPLKVPHLHKIAKSMDMLKLLFTNLKACILTLELHLLPLDVFMPQPFKPSIKTDTDISLVRPKLATELASLLDAFASKGPGRSQFVRIRYTCPSQPLQEDGGKLYETFCYGPLVKVDCEEMTSESPDKSFGAQLLKHAHQLARTTSISVLEE